NCISETDRECMTCGPEHRHFVALQSSLQAKASNHELFFNQLETATDGFNTIAEYFGKGIFKPVDDDDDENHVAESVGSNERFSNEYLDALGGGGGADASELGGKDTGSTQRLWRGCDGGREGRYSTKAAKESAKGGAAAKAAKHVEEEEVDAPEDDEGDEGDDSVEDEDAEGGDDNEEGNDDDDDDGEGGEDEEVGLAYLYTNFEDDENDGEFEGEEGGDDDDDDEDHEEEEDDDEEEDEDEKPPAKKQKK
ncbi:hypothetical protein DYB26_012738, partial [Aphanomyces astaci]